MIASYLHEQLSSAKNPDPEKPLTVNWTTSHLMSWIFDSWGIQVCRETVRRCLRGLGFSYKKAKKLLNKANPEKRHAFLKRLHPLLVQASHEEIELVYIDEAHKNPDTTLGYGWSPEGERLWVSSHSNQLGDRVSLYGVYLYNQGQVRIWDFPKANQDNTKVVLEKLAQELQGKTIKLIWDGASYHRAREVYQAAGSLGIEIIQLPGYSPDFMPVEELWSWMRKELTDVHGFKDQSEFLKHLGKFVKKINQNKTQVADRLWRSISLDPDIEKLRIST